MASENKIPDWENKFNIGIDEVDFQHKYFLQLIHRLKKDFHEDLCETMCKRQLNEVIKYAQFHFYSEENMMMIKNYPHLEEHHEQHNKLIDKLTSLVNYFESGQKNFDEIVKFMVDWFLDHTITEDLKFAQHLNK